MSLKRILIVDDEESILNVLKRSLRKLGADYQVVTVTDGFAALDKILRQSFDLVITDYNMSQMDGLELAEAIRYALPKTRIIMITAYGSPEVEREARRLNVYKYLTKPLDIIALYQTVQTALEIDNKRAVSAGTFFFSDEQYQQIYSLLEKLRNNVSARCVFLTNAEGRTIIRIGDIEKLPVEQITSLLGGGIATLIEAGRTIDGDAEAINLAYREGKNEYLYALNIGQQMLLFLIIDRGPYSSRLGSAWYYAQQTALGLREKLHNTKQKQPAPIFDEALDQAFDAEIDKLFS